MKYLLGSLLALMLMLGGCAAQNTDATIAPETTVPPTAAPETEPEAPAPLYIPGSRTECESNGAFRLYMPENSDCREILALGEDRLLLLSGSGGATTLTVLSGEDLVLAAVYEAPCSLSIKDGSLYLSEEAIGYHDQSTGRYILLNHDLAQTHALTLPEDVTGTAYLSGDAKYLYYATETEMKALELSLGVCHTLRQQEGQHSALNGSFLGGSVLRYTQQLSDGSLQQVYVSSADGSTLSTGDGTEIFTAYADSYLAEIPEAGLRRLMWGRTGGAVREFDPGSQSCPYLFLPGGAVTISSEENVTAVHYFDLDTGKSVASGTLHGELTVIGAAMQADTVYLLCLDEKTQRCRIYGWDLTVSEDPEPSSCLLPWYTADQPDTDGLTALQGRADKLGETYGIHILLWQGAAHSAPEGCGFTAEYLTAVYQRDLAVLEAALEQLPMEFYNALGDGFTICLVRSIQGNGELCGMESSVLPYWQGSRPYIAVTVGESLTESFFHGLGHIVDSKVLSASSALDGWQSLNPREFFYSKSRTGEMDAAWQVYLEGEHRCFVDEISTQYPNEDRAQVFAAALGADPSVFETDAMQEKLLAICFGIREGLKLEAYSGTLPWEVWLHTSLVPEKQGS